MIINFSWGTGKMSVDAELLIIDIPMFRYKKWVKLFVRYGEPKDHQAFLQLLEDQIQANEYMIDGTTEESDLPLLRRMLKRRLSMRDYLKGCLS